MREYRQNQIPLYQHAAKPLNCFRLTDEKPFDLLFASIRTHHCKRRDCMTREKAVDFVQEEMENTKENMTCACNAGEMLRFRKKGTDRYYYSCPDSELVRKGKVNFGCGFFVWEDKLRQCPCGKGPCKYLDKDGSTPYYVCSRQRKENCGYNSKHTSSNSNHPSSVGISSSGQTESSISSSSRIKLENNMLSLLQMQNKIINSPEKPSPDVTNMMNIAVDSVEIAMGKLYIHDSP